jgi:hypothetical protein
MARPPQPQNSNRSAIPNAGEDAQLFDIKKWGGINTKADRTAIDDQEFSWLENFMPIGDGNLRAMFTNATPLYTAAGLTINFFYFFNIGTTTYVAVFFTDGSAVQVNTATSAVTTIAAAGTFYNGGALPAVAQWGNSGIVIVASVAADNYWAWDGTTLFKPGDLAPSWLSGQVNLTPTGNTNSSTSVTAVSSTSQIVAGMGISSSAGDIPANTTVTATTSNTITLSNAATATNVGVTLTVNFIMPKGIKGNGIEIYQSRAWVDNVATKSYSAPGNGARFDGALGGGTITSNDSFLRDQYTIDKQSNGFLYSFGDSSINVISNVQTGGSPVTTTLNNQNVDPQMGTIWPGTVHAFGRGLMFANPSGVYALYGGAAEKVSDKLDGLMADANFTQTVPSGGVATIFGIRCFIFNFYTTDYLGVQRNILAVWDGKKWFMASQGLNTTYIDTQEINSVITCWGTDGTNLFQFFQQPSAALLKTIQTKLWQGDSYLIVKQALRNFSLGTDLSGAGYQLTGTIDAISDQFGILAITTNLISPPQLVIWVNHSLAAVHFQNNAHQNVNFVGSAVLQLLGQNVAISGSLLGETLTSQSPNFTLAALTLLYKRQAPVGG